MEVGVKMLIQAMIVVMKKIRVLNCGACLRS